MSQRISWQSTRCPQKSKYRSRILTIMVIWISWYREAKDSNQQTQQSQWKRNKLRWRITTTSSPRNPPRSPKLIWVRLRETSKLAPTRKSWPRSKLIKMALTLSEYYLRKLEVVKLNQSNKVLTTRPTGSSHPRCSNHLNNKQRSRMVNLCQILMIVLTEPIAWSNLQDPTHPNTS